MELEPLNISPTVVVQLHRLLIPHDIYRFLAIEEQGQKAVDFNAEKRRVEADFEFRDGCKC